MNIVILGMQGAGKTVFISQFYYYLKEKFGNNAIDACDRASDLYVAQIRDILEGNDPQARWPESTKQGAPQTLHFHLNANGITGDLDVMDIAGQDLEELFREDTNQQKQTELQGKILQMLQTADCYVFLFDLLSFAQKSSNVQRVNDKWFFSSFVNLCIANNAPGLIVLSKADEFATLSPDDYANRERIFLYIDAMMPEPKWDLPKPGKLFSYCAVSSVQTQTIINNSIPEKIPTLPLHSQGFDGIF